MAEETPGNLGSMFGGFVAGRAAGNKRLDASVDRLERTIEKFSDSLQRLTASLDSQARSAAGANGGGATQQSSARMGNGGNWSGGHAPQGHRADVVEPRWTGGGGYQGQHAAGAHNGGGWSFGGGGGGGGAHAGPAGGAYSGGWQQNASNAYAGLGGRAGIARKVGAGAAAATAIYTANHFGNQVMGQGIAAQYSYGPNWSQAYRSRGGFVNNYTASSDADAFAATNLQASRGGFAMGTAAFTEAMSGAGSVSFADPSITNQQAVMAQQSMGSIGTFNRMQGLGITTMGRNGQVNPNSIARQILARVPGAKNIRTASQLEAAFGPAGGINITIEGMIRNGFIPPQAASSVTAAIRGILKAQVGGMGYKEYNRLTRTAATNANSSAGDAARDRLQSVGIGNSMIQQQRAKEGLARDTEATTIEGFTKGVSAATSALANFRGVLNKFMNLPGVGDTFGGISGASGMLPGVSGILSRFTPFGGDGPPSMAGSQAMYSSAVGVQSGAVMGSGPASMNASAVQYASARTGSGGGHSGGSIRGKGGPSAGTGIPAGFGLGGVKPWVAKAASILGPKFGIRSMGGVSGRGYASDHPRGLAVDFMCSKAQGDRLAAFAQANAERLNITYIIWYKKIWSVNRRSEGWRPYNSTPDGNTSATALHMDHVHISFLASPSNGDYSGMVSGGSLGSSAQTLGNTSGMSAASPAMGSGSGSSAAIGGYTEVGALGLGSTGIGGGAGGGYGAGGTSSDMSGMGAAGGGGTADFGGGGSIRSGAYNVHNSTSNRASRRDLSGLMGQADALSLTEIVGKKRGLLGWMEKQGWGTFEGKGDASVAYDKDKYEFIRGGNWSMNRTTGPRGAAAQRHAAYALLRDKATGAQFWQVSAHMVPPGHNEISPLRAKIRKEQEASLARLKAYLGKTAPVIIAGDFNMTNPNIGMKSSSGRIDSAMYDPSSLSLTGAQTIKGLSSDHPAVLAQFAMAGAGSRLGNGGSPAQNMALGRSLAAQRGWTGPQWNALKQLWMRESGWRADADNPTSSAYGIPQGLTELHNLGNKYKTDPRAQIQWGLDYIANRYGNPSNAWNFWQKHHSYDQGSWSIRDDQDARVHKGEMILPSKIADVLRNELTSPGIGGKGGGRGTIINFHQGAIQISVSGPMSTSEAKSVGEQVVDAMMEDRRMRVLMEG